MTRLAEALISGTADAGLMTELIDNDAFRQATIRHLARHIEAALVRAESRDRLRLPPAANGLRPVLAELLSRQMAAGCSCPTRGAGRARLDSAAAAWSDRIRRMTWSGNLSYVWEHEPIAIDGNRWGLCALSWTFALVRLDAGTGRLTTWGPAETRDPHG